MNVATVLTIVGIAAYMAMIAIIGYSAYKKNIKGDADDWFLVGRNVNTLMLVGTLLATWFSTFAFLGGPGAFYLNGVNFLLFGFFNSMGPVLIMFFGVRMWLLGKKYGFITPADMLSYYYDESRRLRLLTALVCIGVLFPYAAIQLSGIALALASLTANLIPYSVGIFGLAVCVGVYAIFGGGRAVVWTDAIQGLIFAGLIIVTAIFVVSWSGGWTAGWEKAVRAAPEKFVFDGTTGGTYITLLLLWTFGWVLTPHLWQRMYMSRSARTLVTSSVIASVLALFVVTFTGAVIGFLSMGLDLGSAGDFSSDALVPVLYTKYLPIMGAVLVIAIFAAGMSTLDSQILSASSVFAQDLYARGRVGMDGGNQLRASRRFEIVFVLLLVAFTLSDAGRQLLVPLASIGVGMALVFLMPLIGCLFWPRASEPAAFWSMLSGWIVMLALQFGLIDFLPSYFGAPAWGFVASAIVFYGVSMATVPVSREKQMAFHGYLRVALQHERRTRIAAGQIAD